MNIRKLAEIAGVSTATVSRAINQPHLVLPETRERILEAVRKTGYSKEQMQKVRKKNQHHVLLFLFSEADFHFYELIFTGFEATLAGQNMTVLYFPVSADPKRAKMQLSILDERRFEGVIFALRDLNAEFVERCEKRHIPVVLARKYNNSKPSFPRCYTDFSVGSFRMTTYLLSLGHRKINLLVEKASMQFVESFCGGWKRAFFEADLPYSEDWIIHTLNTTEGGYRKALELFRSDQKPDAFFCASNEMALGVLRAAHHTGIAVPEDLSITGFTDSPIAKLSDPPLTTLEQPIQQLGAVLVRTLLDLIRSKNYALLPPQEIVLQPHLCIRASSARRGTQ